MNLLRLIGLFMMMLCVFPAHAVRNKWVDQEGVTHYGDQVPSEYLGKDREILNDQGLVIKKHKKLKTQEELSEDQKKQAIQARLNKDILIANRKKALRDRVLIDTFTTERDILMARDRRIDAVTSQINLTETIIKEDEKRLSAIKKRIVDIEKSNREVPENTQKSLMIVSNQLENYYQFIESKTQERDTILTDFDRDIKRFRELRAARGRK